MIKALQRKLATLAGDAGETHKDVQMDVKPTPEATLSAEDVLALRAALDESKAALEAANGKIVALTAIVDEAAEFKASKEKAEADAKLNARKDKVVAAVGTAQAEAIIAATASMDDTGFDAVMAALSVKAVAETSGALFKEVGVDAEADQTKVQAGSNGVMDYLTSKYGVK